MSNLQLRLISALVMIPFVFGAIILGGWAFIAFTLIVFALSLYEWAKLSIKTEQKFLFLFAGIIYLPFSFYQFYYLRTGLDTGLGWVITMLIVIWAADTGAYFIGKKFGKHKMAPTISPNKSWEGLGGSMLFAGIAFYLLTFSVDELWNDTPNKLGWVVKDLDVFLIGAFLGFVGQIGDLIESLLKRKSGEKDSSNLIPGHGGVLDRVDSILLTAPFFVFIAIYVI